MKQRPTMWMEWRRRAADAPGQTSLHEHAARGEMCRCNGCFCCAAREEWLVQNPMYRVVPRYPYGVNARN